MVKKIYSFTEDIYILKQLYLGGHLSDDELERSETLLHLLNIELKQRV